MYWYENAVVSHNPLSDMMKTILKQAHLSQIYKNHSIGATCLTNIDEAGFEIRHIKGGSGYILEESIKAYAKKDV